VENLGVIDGEFEDEDYRQASMGGDLEGLGERFAQSMRWGTAHAYVPQYL